MLTPFLPSNNGFEAAVYATVVGEPGDDIHAFEVIRTSQDPELAVYGVERDGRYWIVARRAKKPVWVTAHEAGKYDLRSDRWEAEVAERTFRSLTKIWTRFVSNIRVPKTGEGVSAPEYYFSTFVGGSWVTGYTYGPKPGTCLGDLALLTEELFSFCRSIESR